MNTNNNDNNESLNPVFSESDHDDFNLIKSFNNGNESSYARLLVKHKEKVRNLIFLTLGDTEFIDDIFQDVFINVFHKLSEFRFESKFTTWLYRITVNKCRDYLRKKKVRSIFVPMLEEEHKSNTRFGNEHLDITQMVRKSIEKLPEKLRVPLVLRDIDGFSYKEIADQLECEVGTVKSRIFRARECLKVILEPFQKEISS